MGLAGIVVPEGLGGAGGSVLDLAVALEAAAEALVPGPLLGTAVAVGRAGRARWSRGRGGDAGRARPRRDGIVLDAPGATHALILRGDDVVLVPLAGVDLAPGVSPDLTRRTSRADLTSVEGTVVPGLEPDRLRTVLVTLAAAEASGVARWCLDTAVAYAKTREQFGQPIGAFQAIKHLCAEMLEIVRVGDGRRLGRGAARSTRRPSRRRSRQRSPGPSASTAPSRWPRRASRCSAGSASPSSTTPTSTCAARSRCAPRWARPHDAAARLESLAGSGGVRRQLHVDLGRGRRRPA